jgi:hypothetical protein
MSRHGMFLAGNRHQDFAGQAAQADSFTNQSALPNRRIDSRSWGNLARFCARCGANLSSWESGRGPQPGKAGGYFLRCW